ncbi:MAG TPA: hypothetical protein VKV18_01025 [Chthonomonas sp.]|uniref:hypothetical protein n=1 Tax=Chthonomonas sp. TaxID=2282153 RepID=UPI002B4B688C|nr:hypothetical protein [Chthonomonas sp.]HLI47261.1 hypothetical protein [Chthonomonas sp.]
MPTAAIGQTETDIRTPLKESLYALLFGIYLLLAPNFVLSKTRGYWITPCTLQITIAHIPLPVGLFLLALPFAIPALLLWHRERDLLKLGSYRVFHYLLAYLCVVAFSWFLIPVTASASGYLDDAIWPFSGIAFYLTLRYGYTSDNTSLLALFLAPCLLLSYLIELNADSLPLMTHPWVFHLFAWFPGLLAGLLCVWLIKRYDKQNVYEPKPSKLFPAACFGFIFTLATLLLLIPSSPPNAASALFHRCVDGGLVVGVCFIASFLLPLRRSDQWILSALIMLGLGFLTWRIPLPGLMINDAALWSEIGLIMLVLILVRCWHEVKEELMKLPYKPTHNKPK